MCEYWVGHTCVDIAYKVVLKDGDAVINICMARCNRHH